MAEWWDNTKEFFAADGDAESDTLNEVLEWNQLVGGAILTAFGMGDLANGINGAIDAGQIAANRKGLTDAKGKRYVKGIDTVGAMIAEGGWDLWARVIATGDKYDKEIRKQVPGLKWRPFGTGLWKAIQQDVYHLYPMLWDMDRAPTRPGKTNQVTNAGLTAMGSSEGSSWLEGLGDKSGKSSSGSTGSTGAA